MRDIDKLPFDKRLVYNDISQWLYNARTEISNHKLGVPFSNPDVWLYQLFLNEEYYMRKVK